LGVDREFGIGEVFGLDTLGESPQRLEPFRNLRLPKSPQQAFRLRSAGLQACLTALLGQI